MQRSHRRNPALDLLPAILLAGALLVAFALLFVGDRVAREGRCRCAGSCAIDRAEPLPDEAAVRAAGPLPDEPAE